MSHQGFGFHHLATNAVFSNILRCAHGVGGDEDWTLFWRNVIINKISTVSLLYVCCKSAVSLLKVCCKSAFNSMSVFCPGVAEASKKWVCKIVMMIQILKDIRGLQQCKLLKSGCAAAHSAQPLPYCQSDSNCFTVK